MEENALDAALYAAWSERLWDGAPNLAAGRGLSRKPYPDASGSVTRRKTLTGEAPRLLAALSTEGSIP